MKTACVFLVLAVTSALAMQIRQKRQSNQPDDTNDLEDRYGPWQNRPNGNGFPGQGQFNQFPGQFPGQNQFNGQNQFPGQNQFNGQNQFPGQNQFDGQNPGRFPAQNNGQGANNQQQMLPPTTANPNDATIQECMRSCPVTSEYNPVCGTDGITYTNPGRLSCAQTCGVNVALMRSAPCPATSTMAAPSIQNS